MPLVFCLLSVHSAFSRAHTIRARTFSMNEAKHALRVQHPGVIAALKDGIGVYFTTDAFQFGFRVRHLIR